MIYKDKKKKIWCKWVRAKPALIEIEFEYEQTIISLNLTKSSPGHIFLKKGYYNERRDVPNLSHLSTTYSDFRRTLRSLSDMGSSVSFFVGLARVGWVSARCIVLGYTHLGPVRKKKFVHGLAWELSFVHVLETFYTFSHMSVVQEKSKSLLRDPKESLVKTRTHWAIEPFYIRLGKDSSALFLSRMKSYS